MLRYLSIFFILLSFTLSCEKKESDQKINKVEEITKTDSPKEMKKKEKPKEKVKLVISLPIQKKITAPSKSAELFSKKLTQETGFEFEFFQPQSSEDLIKTMKKDKVQILFGDAWLYLASHHLADGTLLAAQSVGGKSTQKAAWYALAGSSFTFKKLGKKKILFSNPEDPIGYLFPYASLIKEGILKPGKDINTQFSSVLYAGNREAILKDLLDGKADAGPLLVSEYESLGEEKRKKLRLLKTIGEIPTPCFFARSGTKLSVLETFRDALIAMSKSEEGSKMLQDIYGVSTLTKVSHSEHTFSIENAQKIAGHGYLGYKKEDDKPLAPK